MGILSKLLRSSTEDSRRRAMPVDQADLRPILEDEQLQLELVEPFKSYAEARPAYDRDPSGSGPFGFVHTNPIPANGPIGELAYLSKLETISGQRLLFHRLGSVGEIDAFEAVTFDGREWFIFWMHPYHPKKSRMAPEGFRFYKDLARLAGLTFFCENFPYDFSEKKRVHEGSRLDSAFLPIGEVARYVQGGVYNRPVQHQKRVSNLLGQLGGHIRLDAGKPSIVMRQESDSAGTTLINESVHVVALQLNSLTAHPQQSS